MGRFTKEQQKLLGEIASRTPSVAPFPDDTPEKRRERIKRISSNDWDGFRYFAETYFPHIAEKPFCAAHKEMLERTLQNERGITAITGFRGLAKTVLMALIFSIWRLCKGSNVNVQIASDAKLSSGRTAFIHNELKNNIRLIHDFAKLKPMGEDVDEFFLQNKAWVVARSIAQPLRGILNPKTGKRPDTIICDDIDDEKNIGNQNIGFRKKSRITGSVLGALNPDVKTSTYVVWLGNLIHPNMAICQYEAELKQDPDVEEDAHHLVSGSKMLLRFPLEDENGKSVWEEQYPTAKLAELRHTMGNTSYQREMMGKALIEGKIFKNDWFQSYSHLPEMKEVWSYADPAWGTKGCYKAILAIGTDGQRFYLLRVWVRQTENTRFFERFYNDFVDLQSKYQGRYRAACETVFGQHRILQDMSKWCQENGKTDITLQIKRIETKENKEVRIERLDTIIETGKLLFCQGQDITTLISQFLTYPDGAKDGPDSLAGCMERFRSYSVGRSGVKIRRIGLSGGTL